MLSLLQRQREGRPHPASAVHRLPTSSLAGLSSPQSPHIPQTQVGEDREEES